MWMSGWILVPTEELHLLVDESCKAGVEPWDYPGVGFPDGEVEGSDLCRLWTLVCGSSKVTTMWQRFLLEAPDGGEKIATLAQPVIETMAGFAHSRIPGIAEAWQQAESETASLSGWNLEDIVEAIRELKFLARQHLRLQPGWELLMVWFI